MKETQGGSTPGGTTTPGKKDDLNKALESAEGKYTDTELSKYTPESVAAYKDALAKAKALGANATQAEIDAANKALADAIAGLELKDSGSTGQPGTVAMNKVTIAKIKDQTHTGKALSPALTVTYSGKALKVNTDYTVAYKNNVNAGTATVTLIGKGGYTGTVTATFVIKAAKNKTYTVGKYNYKVTNASTTKGTVTFVKPKSKTLKSATVPATVKIGNYKYKVTAVAANVFKSNKKLTKVTIGANVKTIGKTEMWYIVECEEGASLYYGFSRQISKEEFSKRIEDGTLLEVLNRVPVRKGDVFFIEAGTLHIIGKGIVVAEIQQNSNVTYRVYDYGRKGPDGKQRDLHIEKALEVTSRDPKVRSDSFEPHLGFCKYFTVDKIHLDGGAMKKISGEADSNTFLHLLILEGSGTVWGDDQISFTKGDSLLITADTGEFTIEGNCQALMTRIP